MLEQILTDMQKADNIPMAFVPTLQLLLTQQSEYKNQWFPLKKFLPILPDPKYHVRTDFNRYAEGRSRMECYFTSVF